MTAEYNFIQGTLDFKDNESQVIYDLYQYGIFEEKSDIRAHVSDHIIYVFKTHEILRLIKENKFERKFAYQPGYSEPTALGFIIKPCHIKDIRELKFNSWDSWDLFNSEWTTTAKGRWAIDCVIELIRIGRFPFWLETKQTDDVKIDIQGTDILIAMNQKIQVKCDYPAVRTGNLYIQTHEKNPFKLH